MVFGLFESKSSSSSTTEVNDSRIAATGGSTVQRGTTIQNISTEPLAFNLAGAAISNNRDLAGQALEVNLDVLKESYDFAGDTVSNSFNFGEEALVNVDNTVARAFDLLEMESEKNTQSISDSNKTLLSIAKDSIATVERSVRSDAVGTLDKIVVVIGVVLVAVAMSGKIKLG